MSHRLNIPFLSFEYQNQLAGQSIEDAFKRVFESNWYILGRELASFEAKFAGFCGTGHCIGVANGLDALIIALKTLNIGPGDEVIVPANTYIATWLAISNAGATIVPVEPVPDTFNIDPDKISAALTPRTRLIIPVHLFGQPCQMDEIMHIAQVNGLSVVEDNAQAQGAHFEGRMTGGFGEINATSFYPTKNLGAYGDGGALTTNNEALAGKAMLLRNYGSGTKYYNELVGMNSRLDELQAAFLSVKMEYLEQWTQEREIIAGKYRALLAGTGDLVLPVCIEKARHVYHLYVVRTEKRDALQQHLAAEGIETAIHYPVPPHLQKAYDGAFPKDAFPIARQLAATSLSLPLYPGIPDDHLETIAASVRLFYEKNADH